LLASGLLALAGCSVANDGWIVLFDGETLDGWRSFKADAPPAGWVVEDGTLHLAKPGAGDIMTDAAFGDFELEFEWRISKNGNSGVIYFINETDGTNRTYETGPEYQVLDNGGHSDRHDPTHRAAALYDLVAPPEDFTRPVGEYNQGRIIVQGGRIEHWLNGEKVAESPYGDDAWLAMLADSKFADWPEFGRYPSGHIAFQDHSDLVWYRNIRIREL
jgi:cytochrome c